MCIRDRSYQAQPKLLRQKNRENSENLYILGGGVKTNSNSKNAKGLVYPGAVKSIESASGIKPSNRFFHGCNEAMPHPKYSKDTENRILIRSLLTNGLFEVFNTNPKTRHYNIINEQTQFCAA